MFEKDRWSNLLPSSEMELYEPHLKLFFETMYERQLIWKRRFIDKKERPWTENKIFQVSKFTNIYRELDRNSQWQIKNILLDDSLNLKNLVWKMMVFRSFNNPETFEKGKSKMGWKNGIPDWDDYNEDEFSEFISEVRRGGQNPYTAAYLINSQATPGKTRDYCYTRAVVPYIHKNVVNLIKTVVTAKNPEEIIETLKSYPSVADFIAHEYYQDLTYISIYTNRKFMKFDQNDFTNVGPGCSLGIRLIYPSLSTMKAQKPAIYKLRDLAESMLKEIGDERGEAMPFKAWNKEIGKYEIISECNITLHQIEMWLCEFQKYWKMINGQGKQRSKFVPKSKTIIQK